MTNTSKDTVTSLNKECCSIANKAGKKLREEWDNAEGEINKATAATIKHIRSKPLQSGLIAAGIGFILGSLFRR